MSRQHSRTAGFMCSRATFPGREATPARNLGVRAAQTDWVAFLDADDEWLPDHLETFAQLHAATPAAPFLATGWHIVKPGGHRTTNHYTRRFENEGRVSLDLEIFLDRWSRGYAPAWTSAVCMRRDTLIEAGGFPEGRCTRGGDVDTWLRVMLSGRLLACDPQPSAVYHREGESGVTGRSAPQVRHCTAGTVARALQAEKSRRVRRLLKRLGNFHRKDPLRKRARQEGLRWSDLKGFYPLANPLFFTLSVLLVIAPVGLLRRLWRVRRRLRRGVAESEQPV